MLVFLLGGQRSGKSALGEEIARRAAAQSHAVTYVATAWESDGEMAQRIAAHRSRRPADWRTVEAGAARELPQLLRAIAPGGVVLLDCLSLWVARCLMEPEMSAAQVRCVAADALDALRRGPREAIVVSVEAGLGLVPTEPAARRFLDLLGECNRLAAAAADRVGLVTAGLPLWLKGGAPA